MYKLQSELKDYNICFNPTQSYKDLTNYYVKAIAYKETDYIRELYITEEDYIDYYNYRELQPNAKYYCIYKHNNSNLCKQLKVNNIVYNEVYGKYNKLIKCQMFIKLLLNHIFNI